jgi:hypothetical protein
MLDPQSEVCTLQSVGAATWRNSDGHGGGQITMRPYFTPQSEICNL